MTLAKDTSGVVYVEFLIAFMPFLVMFLGMVQVALYLTANLVVRHAATTAARAAVVVLPDDPQYYDNAEINRIERGSGGGGGTLEIGGLAIPGGGGSRLDAIRTAASIPLLAVSPSYEQLVRDSSVARALTGAESRFLTGSTVYNRTAVAVTFPSSPGDDRYEDRFDSRGRVRTRVTYLFHCGVPVVSRILCDDYLSLRTGFPRAAAEDLAAAAASGDTARFQAAQQRFAHASNRLAEESPGVDELNEAEMPYAGIVYSVFGARFRVIRAEAEMTNQGAGFTYED
ncbi:MAG: pilus assembly protein [Deltaproteobacteria bacterium]|nr:pilus assembly protein [Deltaproteobacteria bacterium]